MYNENIVPECTEIGKLAEEIVKKYENLSLAEKIRVLASAFGCKDGKIETSPCRGKWRGSSDISVRFDNGSKFFIGNHLTPKAKTKKVQTELLDKALLFFNPEIIEKTREAALAPLLEREKEDRAVALEKRLKPYLLLNVEFSTGEMPDNGRGGYMGWYYVTLYIDGKFHAHLETGLCHDIMHGRVGASRKKEYFTAGGYWDESVVDFVYDNVGHSTYAGGYTVPMTKEGLERAEKTLAERLAACSNETKEENI